MRTAARPAGTGSGERARHGQVGGLTRTLLGATLFLLNAVGLQDPEGRPRTSVIISPSAAPDRVCEHSPQHGGGTSEVTLVQRSAFSKRLSPTLFLAQVRPLQLKLNNLPLAHKTSQITYRVKVATMADSKREKIWLSISEGLQTLFFFFHFSTLRLYEEEHMRLRNQKSRKKQVNTVHCFGVPLPELL